MIYQVSSILLFSSKAAADAHYKAVRSKLFQTAIINKNLPSQEHSYVQLLISNHELSPPKPSELLKAASNLMPVPTT